jgi:hypothetical protein
VAERRVWGFAGEGQSVYPIVNCAVPAWAMNRRIELCAGEDAPDPVWALLHAVEALARDAA